MNPRIIAGKYKGRKLNVPISARPITDRVKQRMFDLIGDFNIENKIVLDLFAGSGSIGIEALSRGAKYCEFIERDKLACESLLDNCRQINVDKNSFIIHQTSFIKYLKWKDKIFDYIFLDPPFAQIQSLDINEINKLMNLNSILIYKIPSKLTKNEKFMKKLQFKIMKEIKIGENTLLFLKKDQSYKTKFNNSDGSNISFRSYKLT